MPGILSEGRERESDGLAKGDAGVGDERTISARELIAEIKAGASDAQLMAKHGLSAKALKILKNELLSAGFLTQPPELIGTPGPSDAIPKEENRHREFTATEMSTSVLRGRARLAAEELAEELHISQEDLQFLKNASATDIEAFFDKQRSEGKKILDSIKFRPAFVSDAADKMKETVEALISTPGVRKIKDLMGKSREAMKPHPFISDVVHYIVDGVRRDLLVGCMIAALFFFFAVPFFSVFLKKDNEILYRLTYVNPCEMSSVSRGTPERREMFSYTLEIGNTGNNLQQNVTINVTNRRKQDLLFHNVRVRDIVATATQRAEVSSVLEEHLDENGLRFDVKEFLPNTLFSISFAYLQKCSANVPPKIKISAQGVTQGDPSNTAFARLLGDWFGWLF